MLRLRSGWHWCSRLLVLSCALALGSVAAVSSAPVAGAASSPPPQGSAQFVCAPFFGSNRGDGVSKTVSIDGQPVLDGGEVRQGAVVDVELRWDPSRFTNQGPVLVADCVETDREGLLALLNPWLELPELERSVVPLDPASVAAGRWTTSYRVPPTFGRRRICDNGRVGGLTASGPLVIHSDRVCLRVTAGPTPVVPEFPVPALALGVGAVAVGWGLVRLRRRSAVA
jgi:hypothetical protein